MTGRNLTNGVINAQQTTFTTGVVAPGANKLIILMVASNSTPGNASTPSSVSGAGMTWTQIKTVSTTNTCITLYRAVSSSPGESALTFTFSTTQWNVYWSVEEFNGVDIGGTNGSNAIVQSVSNTSNSTGTGITVTLSALGSSFNGAYGAVVNNGATPITAGSGFTELSNISGSQDSETEWATNKTAVNWTWNSANTQNSAIAIEMKAIDGGGIFMGAGL